MSERKFPTEIKLWKYEIERIGMRLGLLFPPTIYEMVDREEMLEVAAYAGYPIRWHHWSYGQDFIDHLLSSRAGSTIFELIINTDPCYGYLLNTSNVMTQKLVIAHATCGHGDFFKNNAYDRNVPKSMHNTLADHAAIIENIRVEFGKERVDKFLEACMSLETMIDLHAPFINRFPDPHPRQADERVHKQPQRITPNEELPYYMDRVLNPPEYIEEQRRRIAQEEQRQVDVEKGLKVPAYPVRDVLGFLLLYAPLERWMLEIIRIIREETFFLYSGAQTKIMNEGWASYWHERILMHEDVALDGEVCPFTRLHAGVLGPGSSGINPYQLGVALWKDVYDRWDTGRHGDIWDRCPFQSVKERWNEFAVFKHFVDMHGLDTPALWRAWDEFSTLVEETYAGNGSYPGEYFSSNMYVSEWLLYEGAESELAHLNAQHTLAKEFEKEIDAAMPAFIESEGGREGLTEELVRFKARHDAWLLKGEPKELLWTEEEIHKEISRREKLLGVRKQFADGTVKGKRILVPEQWIGWAKMNVSPILLGKGLEKIFEVRRTHSDVSFLEDFFTQEFCDAQQFFTFGIKHDEYIPEQGMADVWAIRSRHYRRVKALIKGMFVNVGMPQVELADANFNNNREFYIKHLHDGRDLEKNDLGEVLKRFWVVCGEQKAVHLETIETEWPKKLQWWEKWRPPGYPPLPPRKIQRTKVCFTCSDGKQVTKRVMGSFSEADLA